MKLKLSEKIYYSKDFLKKVENIVEEDGYIKNGMVIAELLMRKAVDIRYEAYSK